MLRPSPLKRRKLYRPPRPEPFPPGLHAEVLARDRMCVESKMDPKHVCKTAFGQEHQPDDLALLTIEHVKETLGMSVPRIHDLAHCIALCGMLNGQPPTKVQRNRYRLYLAHVNR